MELSLLCHLDELSELLTCPHCSGTFFITVVSSNLVGTKLVARRTAVLSLKLERFHFQNQFQRYQFTDECFSFCNNFVFLRLIFVDFTERWLRPPLSLSLSFPLHPSLIISLHSFSSFLLAGLSDKPAKAIRTKFWRQPNKTSHPLRLRRAYPYTSLDPSLFSSALSLSLTLTHSLSLSLFLSLSLADEKMRNVLCPSWLDESPVIIVMVSRWILKSCFQGRKNSRGIDSILDSLSFSDSVSLYPLCLSLSLSFSPNLSTYISLFFILDHWQSGLSFL